MKISQHGRTTVQNQFGGPSVRPVDPLRAGEPVEIRAVFRYLYESEKITFNEVGFVLGPYWLLKAIELQRRLCVIIESDIRKQGVGIGVSNT